MKPKRLLILAIFSFTLVSGQISAMLETKLKSYGRGIGGPHVVMQVRGNNLFIHYDGYGNNWDEWVGPERY